jgi:hypothetical protein
VLFGDALPRLEIYLDLLRADVVPEAKADETLRAVKRTAELVESTRLAADVALEACRSIQFATRQFPRQRLAELHQACRDLAAIAQAVDSIFSEAASHARAALSGRASTPKPRRLALRPLTPTEKSALQTTAPDGVRVWDITPQILVTTVLEHLRDIPLEPAPWAYFGIATGLSRTPTTVDEWKSVKATWSTALARARRVRPDARAGRG